VDGTLDGALTGAIEGSKTGVGSTAHNKCTIQEALTTP